MSDIVDDAHGVERLGAQGAKFAGRTGVAGRVAPERCEHCGSLPKFHPADAPKERLICSGCIRKTSPGRSRAQLTLEWNEMNKRGET